MSRRRAAKYLHLEAESSSNEYESEDYSEDLDNLEPVTVPQTKSFNQLTKELEEKYGHHKEEEDEEEDEVLEITPQAQLIPTPHSPLLFLIRCKIGSERDICARIYDKAKDSEICSIVYKDGLKGYIYIESFKKQAVVDVLATVKNVSRRRFTVVPLKEMVEAISHKKNIVVGDFARIKGGKYRGDLVQILENYEDVVKVKAIPRINSQRRRFDPAEFRTEVVMKDDGYYYNRDFYRNGYLEKIMLKSNLDFDVEPTFAELTDLGLKGAFEINETVKVLKGDLKNIVGVVDNIKGNIAVIKKDSRMYEVNVDDLEKFYEPGQEVSYKGENGVVLSVRDGKVILGMDDFTREVECRVDDVKPSVPQKTVPMERPARFRSRRDPIVHQPVKVTSGEFKGLFGTVKDTFQNKCIVRLRSNLKEVTIDRSAIMVIDKTATSLPDSDSEDGTGFGGKTPTFKTPIFKTPTYKTPSYKTPSYKTPQHGAGLQPNSYYPTEEAGTGWLEPSVYDGACIIADGENHVLSDLKDGVLETRSGKVFLSHEVEFCEPEIYDRVVVMEGDQKGISGTLISISSNNGIVKDLDGKSYNVTIRELARKID